MLFVPTSVANEFIQAAEIVVDSGIFLEIAIPLAVDFTRRVTNVTVHTIDLCTGWYKAGRKRGTVGMVTACHSEYPNITFGMIHPLKISMGLTEWGDLFDEVVLRPLQSSWV